MTAYNIIDGNLLDSDATVICHQVNCQGKMNSRVAKAIRNKYPRVYEEYVGYVGNNKDILGTVQYIHVGGFKYVANLFAQNNYGYDGRQYTSIEAFQRCLDDINKKCIGCTIAFPWKIGCVRGGADWNVVFNMIVETLKDVSSITFYRLDVG